MRVRGMKEVRALSTFIPRQYLNYYQDLSSNIFV